MPAPETSSRPPGTEGYKENAPLLIANWQKLTFDDKPKPVLDLIPRSPSLVLDVGAGIGVDAAALAAMGHQVVAVEPVTEFVSAAKALYSSPAIEWVEDSLPHLDRLRSRRQKFDLVMLSAVWMHLDQGARALAFPRVAELLQAGGRIVLSIRHGPVPDGRRMFDVPDEETLNLASAQNLRVLLHMDAPSVQPTNRAAGVWWIHMAFEKPST